MREREREERALDLINDAMEIDLHGKKLKKKFLILQKIHLNFCHIR